MSSNTSLSNLSYTNKDFNSIYAELLEYAKKISYKWDPSASDESDPGLVLLKLAALIGDKDNYNIDKNILELMPASVTQQAAARQLFDQCGYNMRYYRSAEGELSLTIKSDLGPDLDSYKDVAFTYVIPQFTAFTDADSSIVYTSTEAISLPVKTMVSVPVIEGTAIKYSVNNDTLITRQNLDSLNRLYFSETNVAENGIFITNVNSNKPNVTNYAEWKRVDNLYTQPRGTLCYKFGLTIDGSICYIQFPDDIDFLIGEGLNITYILTQGATGNVSANALREFQGDTKFTRVTLLDKVEVSATTETVVIRNSLPITTGTDPESISEAYKNYSRVRDTFDTLVSVKDYSDFLVSNDAASNAFVCDRTNDIQHSYKIITTDGNTHYTETAVETSKETLYRKHSDKPEESVEIETPSMTAFDLCVYALQNVGSVNSISTFLTSYQISEASPIQFLNSSTAKSLQHNFIPFEPNRILMIKNKYKVTANIVPRYNLSQTEKLQVLYNVETALCTALNARNMTFGEGVSLDVLQEALLNADERIKNIIDFTSPKYETYAVYKDANNGKFEEMRIDAEAFDAGYVATSVSDTSSIADYYYRDIHGSFKKAETYKVGTQYYEWVNAKHQLWNDFRVEIFAKNVLAGVTPLYDIQSDYTAGVNQTQIEVIQGVNAITSNTNVTFSYDSDPNKKYWISRSLENNESMLFTAPNFVKENSFSSYVKLLYKLNSDIEDGQQHELQDGEFVIVLWKDSQTTDKYTYIKYDSSSDSLAKYFAPSGLSLSQRQNLSSSAYPENTLKTDVIERYFSDLPSGKGSLASAALSTSSFVTTAEIKDPSVFIEKCLTSTANNHVLTGSKMINTYTVNTIHINNSEDGSSYIYWILNSHTSDNKYELFADSSQYTLRSGEYFLYTNDEKSGLYLLGEGTVLTRGGNRSNSWKVPVIEYEDLLTEGISILDDKWFTIAKVAPSSVADYNNGAESIWATEQQQILVGEGNLLIVKDSSTAQASSETLTSIPGIYATVSLTRNDVIENTSAAGVEITNLKFTCNDDLTEYSTITYDSNSKKLSYTGETQSVIYDLTTLTTEESVNDTLYFKNSAIDVQSIIDIFKTYFVKAPTFHFDISNDSKSLQRTAISYQDTQKNATALPQLDGADVYWSATSILNIDMSNTIPQELTEHQSIIAHTIFGDKRRKGPRFIQSKDTLDMLGGKHVPISSILDNVTQLFTYKSAETPTQENNNTLFEYKHLDSTVVSVIPPSEELSYELSLTFQSLPGNYLLKAALSNVQSIELSVDNTTITSLGNSTWKLSVQDTGDKTLKFSITRISKTEDAIVTLLPLIKFTTDNLEIISIGDNNSSDNEDITFETQLLDKLESLDISGKFDYTYVPSDAILNPLVAESFLKTAHAFNQYTICQWDTDVANSVQIHTTLR